MATGMVFKNDAKVGPGVPCVMGKQHRVPLKGPGKRASKLLELVHTDLCGPTNRAIDNSYYFFTLIDDLSRKPCVYFLAKKSDVFLTFRDWKIYVENQTGGKIKVPTFRQWDRVRK